MVTFSFQSLVNIFTRDQSPLVWSFLVSVFGDLAQREGLRLSSGLIGEITQAVGIKPEATRVALHRLRKEDWLESERTGRSSAYFLTKKGRAETIAASPRIYSADAPADSAWLVVAENGGFNSGVKVGSGIFVSAERPMSNDLLTMPLVSGERLPDWMMDRICPTELVLQSVSAKDMFLELEARLLSMRQLNPIETAALRVLIVHTWRKIVLRSPILPDIVFPKAWTGPDCRAAAHRLLQALPAPPLRELST